MKLKLAGDRAKAFPQVDNPSGYTELEVWNCGYGTLSPISRFTELRTLLVGRLPDPELDFLASSSSWTCSMRFRSLALFYRQGMPPEGVR